ncbi:MAG: helix-turn-helix domain-containing protein [Bacteroidales bacterium]|nr:helix-turn-helix domain-containing protein [Bacteroidales bacterium]
MTDNKHPQRLADILKDYFQNSNEPLAVDFRKQFAGTDNPLLALKPGDETSLEDWLDNQDVMQALHVSPRTLQTLRSNGLLPFSRIGNKLYYRRQDIIKILSDNYTMRKIQNYGRDK